jgi:hypothetical protein
MRPESVNRNEKTPASPDGEVGAAGLGVTPAGANKYIVEGDPREGADVFDKFVDTLRAAYTKSLNARSIVCISFYESEDEPWPLAFILTQPFNSSGERYAVLMNEDRAPLVVFDFEEMSWSEVAKTILYIADTLEKIAKIEIEVGKRW